MSRTVWTSDCKRVTLVHGECIQSMRSLPKERFDAIVSDPPYGLGFMGKQWDKGVPNWIFWKAASEVAKPGANLLAFGGTRCWHRLAINIERAKWELRDTLCWLYGSGFPKSLDLSRSLDESSGVQDRPIVGEKRGADRLRSQTEEGGREGNGKWGDESGRDPFIHSAVTEAAKVWEGFGTALKPAWEPIIWAMKELDGTFADNAMQHGVAGVNVDACRVGSERRHNASAGNKRLEDRYTVTPVSKHSETAGRGAIGRFPANVLHDGSDEVLQGLSGETSRFFYCAKPSKKERGGYNMHPTVKPIALMLWLCKLVSTPSGGEVLDPFMGSGTTGVACVMNGQSFVGIEKDADSFETAKKRIVSALKQVKGG